jgi:hypothetical protein
MWGAIFYIHIYLSLQPILAQLLLQQTRGKFSRFSVSEDRSTIYLETIVLNALVHFFLLRIWAALYSQ